MGWAVRTGLLAGTLEYKLQREIAGPQGSILPVPTDGADESVEDLRKDLGAADGGTSLVETTSAGFGEGRSAAPLQDWKANRYGANPPLVLASLRTEAAASVLSACGVSPVLFSTSGAAPLREALRLFVHTSVKPLAKILEAEITHKLDTDVSLDFKMLAASDVTGKARALAGLVKSGVSLDDAKEMAGFTP